MEEKPKYRGALEGLSNLSLGISMVVAVAIGVGLGILMQNFFESVWGLVVGIVWGIAAAVMNVYKAYKKQLKDLDEFNKNRHNFDDN